MDLMARADANTGTTGVRAGFEFDVPALEAWLVSQVAGYGGPLSIEQFKGGQSNPTYKLVTPRAAYVLRSKPAGVLVASAHAIDREFRVMEALKATAAPVPPVHAFCDDDGVIGRHFYVMGFTPGPIVWDLPTERWTKADRARHWTAGAAAAASLHRIDPAEIGLGDFGRQGGYVARQLRRWTEQYCTHTRDAIANPALDRLIAWLPERLPLHEPTRIVHGDLQLSNMIQRPDGTGVAAIIDWELSTLGNPISDFAYYCRDYYLPAEAGGFGGSEESLGIPPESEMVALWTAATGQKIGDDWPIYIIFNMFRLAAIRQGVAKRARDGTATSANPRIAAQGAVTMADAAWRLAEEFA